ncbi:MAG TPA: FtsX-like permease family protein, partial [Blastocatellia bacterium]|nr:FtsX-like permease family protein [Blastocatellia bacterium]
GAMSSLEVEGRETTAAIHSVSPGYFRTLRINLMKGRAFSDQDRVGGRRVAILNRTAAERFFHGQDPLGKHINVHLRAHYPGAEQLIEVVGVAEDVRYGKIDEVIEPEIYLSAWQPVVSHPTLIIRGSVDPAALVSAVRREVRLLDPNLPVYGVRTMRERVAEVTSRTRFIALMLSLFAGLALTISAIGIYGIMAYAVSIRTKEIGIRLALGAQTGDVMRLVLRQGMGMTVAGLVIGLAASYAVTHVLGSQLYGVEATDPATFALVIILLTSVALAACYIPAKRAAGVDPMAALRYE